MRLAVVFLMLSSAAFAQTSPVAKGQRVPVQNLDFTASDVRGVREKPVLDLAVIPERPIFVRRIQVRGSFANELHRSVDAVR